LKVHGLHLNPAVVVKDSASTRRTDAVHPKKESVMSKQEEAGLILKLYELRREATMRQARDWYFLEFNRSP
jgi:hypothetical protein